MSLLLRLTALNPSNGWGIAANYLGDEGIERDSRVHYAENFETEPTTADWMKEGGWFAGVKFGPGQGMVITDRVAAAGGKRYLKCNLKEGQKNSGGVFRLFKPGDVVYAAAIACSKKLGIGRKATVQTTRAYTGITATWRRPQTPSGTRFWAVR